MTRPLVLVVEDDRDLRQLLATIVGLLDVDVDTAANGLEALAAVRRREPQLILLDMRMPIMDGWEFSRELDRMGPRPPIIVITAAPDPKEPAAEVRADGWLGKPFDMHQLTELVRRHTVPAEAGAPLP